MRLILGLLVAGALSLLIGLAASEIAALMPCRGEDLACALDEAIGAYAVLIWTVLGPAIFYQANGKAIALSETEGLIKTIFDAETGELLGAHMIGAEVTELIQGFAIAKSLETTEAELISAIFPHPTLSETMHELVLDAYGRALHI